MLLSCCCHSGQCKNCKSKEAMFQLSPYEKGKCQNVQSIDSGPHLECGGVGEPVVLPSSVPTELEVMLSTPMLPPPVPMAVRAPVYLG